MKTKVLKAEEVNPEWWVVDAEGLPLGRLATRIAMVLMGKHRPDYTPHVACGDFVLVINAEKVKLTGNKLVQKKYTRYTGFPSGQRHVTAGEMRERKPGTLVRLAVERMLPKNKLAYKMIRRLKVYAGSEHPHQAQQPKPMEVKV